MARTYISQPTLDIDFIKPKRMSFDIAASGIDGGRNLANQSISADTSGGGFVVGAYENCWVQSPEEHEYANWISARLNGSFRFINVPIKTDWMGPFPVLDRWPVPIIQGITHSDGSLFSDGSGYSQATVWGSTRASAALNAGVISMRVYGASRPLRWSDWFSIYHGTRMGWRAYRYWEVQSMSDEFSATVSGATMLCRDYTLAISPPLREAVATNIRIEIARPRFVGKLAPGVTVPWEVEGFWVSRPTLQFVEAY